MLIKGSQITKSNELQNKVLTLNNMFIIQYKFSLSMESSKNKPRFVYMKSCLYYFIFQKRGSQSQCEVGWKIQV